MSWLLLCCLFRHLPETYGPEVNDGHLCLERQKKELAETGQREAVWTVQCNTPKILVGPGSCNIRQWRNTLQIGFPEQHTRDHFANAGDPRKSVTLL